MHSVARRKVRIEGRCSGGRFVLRRPELRVFSIVGEQRFVAQFRRHDGDQRWMTVVSRPLVNDDGLTTGAVVGMRDVHDLVVAQRAAEESETRYRLLAEHSSDVIFLSNERTDLEWVSPSSRDTLGWDSEQLTGRRAVEFIHPDELAMLRRNVTESTQSGATIRVRYRWLRPDGGYRWMEAVGRPFVDERTVEYLKQRRQFENGAQVCNKVAALLPVEAPGICSSRKSQSTRSPMVPVTTSFTMAIGSA